MFVCLALSEAFVNRDAIRAEVLIPIIFKKSRLVNIEVVLHRYFACVLLSLRVYTVFLANTSKLALIRFELGLLLALLALNWVCFGFELGLFFAPCERENIL